MSSTRLSPVRDMFETLVPKYDRFNRVSSLGLDGVWRREIARVMANQKQVLDVGTGTGDVVQELLAQGASVLGVDFSERMIQAAKEKLGNNPKASFVVASANELPFEASRFDGITSAFVIRNLHHEGIMEAAFREFNRVLKEGGKMVHLELTRPPHGVISWGHALYLKSILPIIGRVIFKNQWPKDYLSNTIQHFPTPQELCQRIRWAGFENVCHYPLNGGIASLFCGTKCST